MGGGSATGLLADGPRSPREERGEEERQEGARRDRLAQVPQHRHERFACPDLADRKIVAAVAKLADVASVPVSR